VIAHTPKYRDRSHPLAGAQLLVEPLLDVNRPMGLLRPSTHRFSQPRWQWLPSGWLRGNLPRV